MKYRVLNRQIYSLEEYSIVPVRQEDKTLIMQWRNEQIYHLRQARPLTEEDQNNYFTNVVSELFDQKQPTQILFSYLKNGVCIGYGGLVHINWIDQYAEISFVMNTKLETNEFAKHWQTYLSLIEQVAFDELRFHKIFTYAFDLRPGLYVALEGVGYKKEAVLKEHCFFNGEYKDVIIHSKFNAKRYYLKPVQSENAKLLFDWANDNSVRENSFNSEPIIWDNHLKWFNEKIKADTTQIFIMYEGIIPLGQIRLDLINNFWEVDYSIDNIFRGKGLGKKIVELINSQFSSKYPLKAVVKKENIASLKVFQQLGFQEIKEEKVSTFIKTIN